MNSFFLGWHKIVLQKDSTVQVIRKIQTTMSYELAGKN
jgi:hypothetical protein